MRMSKSDLHRQTTLRCSNVDDRLVLLPGKFCREGLRNGQSPSGHPPDKLFECLVVGVNGRIMASRSRPALRFPSLQRRREHAPMRNYVSAEVLQLSANVGGFSAIEKKVGFRHIHVKAAFVAIKHA